LWIEISAGYCCHRKPIQCFNHPEKDSKEMYSHYYLGYLEQGVISFGIACILPILEYDSRVSLILIASLPST